MPTLAKKELLEYLAYPPDSGLVVTPILDRAAQIGEVGIDLRLGNQFIVFKSENLSSFDPKDLQSDRDRLYKIQEQIALPPGEPLVLHPGHMVLGSTFEYVSMPPTLEASLEGRSSWARIGLVIATATTIEPGFKGCITLELANVANIPLKLYSGSRIAQLLCHHTSASSPYPQSKKYLCPVGPEFSRVHLDTDTSFFFRKLTSSGGHTAPGANAAAPTGAS